MSPIGFIVIASRSATRASRRSRALCAAVLAAIVAPAFPARASDGCLVMLCLAAPDWRQVPQCVPPVRQLLHDLARGRPFPRCDTGSTSNSIDHEWARAPTLCPSQYIQIVELEAGFAYTCAYTGAISVRVDGTLFTRTWWSVTGDSVTEFTPAAKAQLGTWNGRFDNDLAAWLASQPKPAPPPSV